MSELMKQAVPRWASEGSGTTGIITMVLEGELDRAEVQDLTDMVAKLMKGGSLQVVIDFADVTHFDYRGVKPLMRHAGALRELGGDLKLSGLSPYVYAIFCSAGGHGSFDYFSEAAAAAASFERALPAYG